MLKRLLLLVPLLASPAAAEPFRDCPDCPEMIALPVLGLAVGRTEVTFAEWDACEAAGVCRHVDDHGWGRGRMPVVNVAFDDAETYLRWLSGRSGKAYRLPTEGEWEAAARAGSASAYWWGDEPPQGRANCSECFPGWNHRPAPVASFPPNPWGVHDMHGNVWEWVQGCTFTGPGGDCRERAAKGGSWYFTAANAKASSRSAHRGGKGGYDVGFRVVRKVD
jgi:formylglycine-generating enzyme required for sulfatase activity